MISNTRLVGRPPLSQRTHRLRTDQTKEWKKGRNGLKALLFLVVRIIDPTTGPLDVTVENWDVEQLGFSLSFPTFLLSPQTPYSLLHPPKWGSNSQSLTEIGEARVSVRGHVVIVPDVGVNALPCVCLFGPPRVGAVGANR